MTMTSDNRSLRPVQRLYSTSLIRTPLAGRSDIRGRDSCDMSLRDVRSGYSQSPRLLLTQELALTRRQKVRQGGRPYVGAALASRVALAVSRRNMSPIPADRVRAGCRRKGRRQAGTPSPTRQSRSRQKRSAALNPATSSRPTLGKCTGCGIRTERTADYRNCNRGLPGFFEQ